MLEPAITVNGTSLTEAQAVVVRVAVTDFQSRMSEPGALGRDVVGEDIRRGYQERSGEILRVILTPPPSTNVGSIVPAHCSGYAFVFEPGVLHVKKDGSGYIAVDEDDFVLEDDRDGEGGSVHWIVRMEASEITALRDFLNGTTQQHVAVLEKPARVGSVVFRKGVSVQTVIEAAQRLFEKETPIKKCGICDGPHDNDALTDICTFCEARINEEGSP